MALRILVVDDEPYIVDGVTRMLRELEGFPIEVESLYSPEEALRAALEKPFDLMIVDIEMPTINGLDLIRRLNERGRRARVIFLTGYSDYEYMRGALRQGSYDYVLKLCGMKALRESVVRALGECSAERSAESGPSDSPLRGDGSALLEVGLVRDLFSGRIDREALRRQGVALNPERPTVLLTAFGDSRMDRSQSSMMALRVSGYLREQTGAEVYALAMPDGIGCWIAQDAHDDGGRALAEEIRSHLDALARQMEPALGFAPAFAVSEGGAERREAAAVCERLWQTRVSKEPLPARERAADAAWAALETAFAAGEREDWAEAFWKILDEPDSGDALQPVRMQLLKQALLRYAGKFCPEQTALAAEKPSPESLRMAARRLFEASGAWEPGTVNSAVAAVQRYIAGHLTDDLSLPALSELVHLNPSYLSRLFRRVNGRRLSDYIASVRIDCARRLLRTTDLHVQEISAQVGFENASYFTTAFKRAVGCSPQKYRERFGR